ncbi:MAG: DUF1007 family protein, partial [Campylobacterota bacterium]|nr:DUF1007 family protein [Campylobacterota bacterium]
MKNILKLFVLTLLFYNHLFGCTLCKLKVPITQVKLNVDVKKDYITMDISWEFSKEFSEEALFTFDKNKNTIYEKNELEEVNKSIYEYLKKDSYLTFVKLIEKNSSIKQADFIKSTFLKSDLIYENEKIIYNYSLKSNIEVRDGNFLYIRFFDLGGNFDFNLVEYSLKGISPNSLQKEKNSIKIYLYDNVVAKTKKELQNTKPIIEKEKKVESNILDKLSELLTNLKDSIKELLNDIKSNNSPMAYLWLLVFSFLYGIIHAIGPGHGKSLVSAY